MISPNTPDSKPVDIFSRFFEPNASLTQVSAHPDLVSDQRVIFRRFFDQVAAPEVRNHTAAVPEKGPVTANDPSIQAQSEPQSEPQIAKPKTAKVEPKTAEVETAVAKTSILSFKALKTGLSKTRNQFAGKILQLFSSQPKLDEALIESIETQLLMSDVGMQATQKIIAALTSGSEETLTEDVLKHKLKAALLACLETGDPEEFLATNNLIAEKKTQVILVVGVNGVGKTTTIGKLALRFSSQGKSVMLAAGDTFRAAAVEQLQVWGERNQVLVVAQETGADSASVIYDALSSAQSKGVDVLIADTAGRLHNKSNLMEELKKIQRVMKKLDPDAPHEVLLVVDGGTGQNALSQGREFHKAMGLTGIVITKLDGTAKGGILFALVDELKVPVRFIGVGEQAADLRDFSAQSFVDALIDPED